MQHVYGTGLHVILIAELALCELWSLLSSAWESHLSVQWEPTHPWRPVEVPFPVARGRNDFFLPKISIVLSPTHIHIHNHFPTLVTYGNVFLPSLDCGLLISQCFLEHHKYSKDLMNKQTNWLVSYLGSDCIVTWLDEEFSLAYSCDIMWATAKKRSGDSLPKLNSVETYRQVIESIFIREPDEFKIDGVLWPVDV